MDEVHREESRRGPSTELLVIFFLQSWPDDPLLVTMCDKTHTSTQTFGVQSSYWDLITYYTHDY
jgi:hypothetical protein